MRDIMIDVNDVSIRFNLEKEKVNSIKEYFIRRLKGQIQYDEFWALKHITFQVERGDSVGLVGLNGTSAVLVEISVGAHTALLMYRSQIWR